MKKLIIILLALLTLSAAAKAQDWVQTNGPTAYIENILFDNQKNIYFLSPDKNIKSTDKGNTWQTIDYSFIGFTQNGNYFASRKNVLLRSQDNGLSWDSISTIQKRSLKIFQNNLYLFDFSQSVLLKSIDLGATWSSSKLPAPLHTAGEAAVDSNGVLLLYIDAVVLHSADNGLTWSGDTVGKNSSYYPLFCAKKGNIFLANLNEDFSVHSSDDGKTWQELPLKSGLFAISSTGRILFAGKTADGDKILYSDDDGFTWINFGDLQSWRLNGTVSLLKPDPDSGYYIQDNETLFHAEFPGLNPWNPVNFPLSNSYIETIGVSSKGSLVVTLKANIAVSNDQGNSWTRIVLDSTYPYIKWFSVDSVGDIFCGGDGKVYRSTNNGINWELIPNTPLTSFTGIVLHQSGIFFASSLNYLYKSDSRGMSWERVQELNQKVIYSISADPYGKLFAPTDGGYYCSADIGKTWELCGFDDANFPGGRNFPLIFDPYYNIYSTNPHYPPIYKSYDLGKTWIPSSKGVEKTYVYGTISTPDGTIFEYTEKGIFKLPLGDCSWVPFSGGLSEKKILCLTYDKDGRLYAGTAGNGVYKSVQTFNASPQLHGRLLTQDILFDTLVSQTLQCKDIVLKNIGVKPFTLKSFTVTDPVPFSVADESAKKLPFVLNPRDSVTMTICFHPTQAAHYASSIIWNTDIDASLCTGISNESLLEGLSIQKSSVSSESQESNFSIHPNPIQEKAEIHFSLSKGDHVRIECFDMLGRRLKVLADGNYESGENSLGWDTSDLPDGTYIIQCSTGSVHSSHSVIVLH